MPARPSTHSIASAVSRAFLPEAGKIEYTVELDQEAEAVIVHVTGTVTRPHDSLELQRVGSGNARERGVTRILCDMTEAKVVGSTLDIHEAGRGVAVQKIVGFEWRVALVYGSEEQMADHEFLETVVRNTGIDVRVFSDLEVARAWLTREDGAAEDNG